MSDDDNSAAPAIGIDLGTAYSCVGVFQNGKVEIIPNDHFNRTTPSYVTFNEMKWLAGEVAKNQWPRDPENTVFDAKRMIGRDFDDEELRRDMKRWPFKVLKDRGIPKVEVQYMEMTKLFTFEEMSSMVLTKMKSTAEAYLKKTVTKAVMTVPAHFTDAQRQATEKAGKMAGLDVMDIIDEPTAAVLANGLDTKLEKGQKVLIFDLGGGTFDVSVLAYTDQGFQVISTAGDAHFGGDDFDHRLVNYFANEFKSQHKIDPRNSPMSTKRLKLACEEAKKTLSNSLVAHIKLNSLFERIDFAGKVSRACFDELCEDLYRKTLDTVQRALDDANLKRTDIDEVILAGGSTRIPKVRKLLKDFFDGKKLNLRINAVAFGATVQAAILSGQDVSDVDRQIDVIPYSLGVQEDENHLQILIKRNSEVPIRVAHDFVLGEDDQTTAKVYIYAGDHPNARSNHLLGEFLLDGIKPVKRGEMTLKIVFDVDAYGIMTVTAKECAKDSKSGKSSKGSTKDSKSGKSKEIKINCIYRLGPEELEKMQENAERMEAEAEEEEEKRRQEKDKEERERRQGKDKEERFNASLEGDGPRDDGRSEVRGKSEKGGRELNGGSVERKGDTSPQAGRKRSKDRRRKSGSFSEDGSRTSGGHASRTRRSERKDEKRKSDASTAQGKDRANGRKSDKQRETKKREKDAERKGNRNRRRKSDSSSEDDSRSSGSDSPSTRPRRKRDEKRHK